MRSLVALVCIVVILASTVCFAADKPQVSPELAKVMEYYVGTWSVSGALGDAPIKGRAAFRMPAGKHCFVGTVSYRAKQERMHFSLVAGWDSSTGWYTEQGLGSDGGVYTIKWRKVSDTVEEGNYFATVAGKKSTAKVRLVRKGDGEFTVSVTEGKTGDESDPDLTLIYHRVARDKAKRKARE